MCEHCGCRQIEPLAELMDEHYALLDRAADLESAIGHGDVERADALWRDLTCVLARHVRREEDGVFTAMRQAGEYVEEVDELEGEHRDLDQRSDDLQPSAPDFMERFKDLAAHLSEHIERENLGIFPVSVVTLDASGWDIVARTHEQQPTFLDQGRTAGTG